MIPVYHGGVIQLKLSDLIHRFGCEPKDEILGICESALLTSNQKNHLFCAGLDGDSDDRSIYTSHTPYGITVSHRSRQWWFVCRPVLQAISTREFDSYVQYLALRQASPHTAGTPTLLSPSLKWTRNSRRFLPTVATAL